MSEAPLWYSPPKGKAGSSRPDDRATTSTAETSTSEITSTGSLVDADAITRTTTPVLPPPLPPPLPPSGSTARAPWIPPPRPLPEPPPVVGPVKEDEPVAEADSVDRRRSRVRMIALILLAVIGVGFVAVEAVGRRMIEGVAERQIRGSGVAGEVDVTVGTAWWSPTITRLLVTRRLDRADVELRSAHILMLPIHEASYRLSDLDVSFSVRHRTVRVNSLKSGKVLVVVDPAEMSDLLGVVVTARSGELYLGDSVEPATVAVMGAELVITSPVLAFINGTDRAAFPVVDPYLLPCEPSAKLRGSFIELKCTGSELPGILGQTIGLDPEETVGDSDVPAEIGPSNSTVLEPQPTTPGDTVPLNPTPSSPAKKTRRSRGTTRRPTTVAPGGTSDVTPPSSTIAPGGTPNTAPTSPTVQPQESPGAAPPTSTAAPSGTPTTAPSPPSTGASGGSPATTVPAPPSPAGQGI